MLITILCKDLLSDQLLSGQLKKLKDSRAADKEELKKLQDEEKEKKKVGLTYWQALNCSYRKIMSDEHFNIVSGISLVKTLLIKLSN